MIDFSGGVSVSAAIGCNSIDIDGGDAGDGSLILAGAVLVGSRHPASTTTTTSGASVISVIMIVMPTMRMMTPFCKWKRG